MCGCPEPPEAELHKQCMWMGLTREGFLEEGSQDAGDGDVGACGSHTHTLWLYLCRASLSRRGLGDNQPCRGSFQLLGPQEAGIGRGS